mmetsp:Transcript_111155/g.321298  ORF Transcript_111155/g.321298 Transcript_111155/m.321298 type:complete len:264 (-) Transcript_111155:67-858(-)
MQRALVCANHQLILPTREVDDALALRRQAAHQSRETLGRVEVAHRLLAQAQLPIVVAAPHPQLSGAGHGRRKVVAGAHLDDLRGLAWGQDRIVRIVEILDLPKLGLVARVAMPEQPKLAFPCGVYPALLREHDGVLAAASDLRDSLARVQELLHLLGPVNEILAAIAQAAHSTPKASAPTPCPQHSALGDRGGVATTQGDLCHNRFLAVAKGDELRVAAGCALWDLPTKLRILVRPVGVKAPANHKRRVAGAASSDRHASKVF